ncbi:paralemmin-3 [Sebastes fasciatus]|uniref:paralemmin-3 n=1 Tax=Sebastes fasciatus TaxID=394691 RepID=UPI003D9E4B6B
MDETEKYKQRLEAIAEKRRLQEEQDRARRDMEDEKLRLQQLKRKSLRDQWLMEGAPLSPTSPTSPTSPDAQSPRSPLWGSPAQEMEKHTDKLESGSQRLAEEEEKLKEQMEDGQTVAVKVTEARAEMIQDALVQNGENNATGWETTEDEVQTNLGALLDETAAVLTNGGGHFEADTNHDTQSATNGLIGASEGVISMKWEPGLSLGASEAEPGQVPNVNINEEEEEEGTVVMRAERVIVTDEGDDIPEDVTRREDQQETAQSEETPLPHQEAGQEGGEAVKGVITTEAAPEAFTQPEKSEATKNSADTQTATGDGDVQGGVDTNGDGETKSEGRDKESEDPTQTVQVQSPANALGGTAVASVPVYSEAQLSTLTPELEAEGEAAASPEGAEAAVKAQDLATLPGQFQEVPLAEPRENRRTEARPGEREPLLSQAKTPDTQAAEPAAATSTETHSLTRASQGEETGAPKHKACMCCSVM